MNNSSSTGEIMNNLNRNRHFRGPKVFLNGVLIQNSFIKGKENKKGKNLKNYLTSTENKTNKTSSIIIDPNIDNEINNLYKQYCNSKLSRKQSEVDYNRFSNKINLLKKEETKIKEKQNHLMKSLEKKEKIQYQNIEEKEFLFQDKIRRKEELEKKKINNNALKNERDKCLKNFRKELAKTNLDINVKLKKRRKSNFDKYKKREEEMLKEKRDYVIHVNKQRAQSQENKKQSEYEKKLKIKEELIKKIKEEENKKLELKKGTNKFQYESKILINNIKNLNQEFHKSDIIV